MNTRSEELLREILGLDPSDRLWLSRELLRQTDVWPAGIEKTPGVCGGDARLVRTRIAVWTLEQLRRQGASDAEILQSFPTVNAEDLFHAWTYVDLHPAEIDAAIVSNEEA